MTTLAAPQQHGAVPLSSEPLPSSDPIDWFGTVLAVVMTFITTLLLSAGVLLFHWLAFVGGLTGNPVVLALAFALGTDGMLLALSVGRRAEARSEIASNPEDVTVVIACYNGEKVIPQTLERVLRQVPRENVIVVSDTSSDETAAVAHRHGVRVVENRLNRNKALSINRVASMITTKYTMILDDDTLIPDEPIPTGLLDEGYSAVAFNVMPISAPGLVNAVQRFEYRKSMMIGKALRSRVGAISNVSGAVGLFRSEDIKRQAKTHSGQFGGEDQQRTFLTHLNTSGRGVAYHPARVETLAPDTWSSLFRQRAFKWGMATHETFVLNLRLIANRRTHYLLKLDRATSVFVFLTDSVRIVMVLFLFFRPVHFLILYAAYLPLEVVAWLRTGRKDSIGMVLVFPAYSLFRNIARFLAHFYWFRVKYEYLITKRFHHLVPGRRLVAEYATVTGILAVGWIATFWTAARILPGLNPF